MAKLGEIIKNYRYSQRPRITLDEFAKRSGLSKSYLSMLENEKFPRGKQPKTTSDVLVKIATGMNISVNDVISQLDDNEPIIFVQSKEATERAMRVIDTAVSENENYDVDTPPYGYVTNVFANKKKPIIAPVLGRVAAGIPIEMIDNVIDKEELDPDEYKPGTYFGLKIKGDSMEPKIENGDVIIVRQQDDVECGQYAVVTINGEDATCKKVMKQENGIMLVSINPQYPPKFFSNEEIDSLPVRILGKVVESRSKFE